MITTLIVKLDIHFIWLETKTIEVTIHAGKNKTTFFCRVKLAHESGNIADYIFLISHDLYGVLLCKFLH